MFSRLQIQGRVLAGLEKLESGVIIKDGDTLCSTAWATICDDIDHIKQFERFNCTKQHSKKQQRLDIGKGYRPKGAPFAGAINLSGLVEIFWVAH